MFLEKKSILSASSFNDVKGVFTGYASVFNEVDLVNDTVSLNAYDDEIKAWQSGKSIPVNFDHQKSITLSANLNSIISDSKGLLVEWTFSEEAKSLYPDIWHWAVSKAKSGNLFMSIGYTVLKSTLGSDRSKMKAQRMPDKLFKISLDHIAATDAPVDQKAKVLEVKGFNIPRYPVDLSDNWDAQSANKRWREYTKSVDAPSPSYKNGFLFIEDGREELFGSYHFQVVDIIDGEPMINQRAVIAAHAYLNGARRGVKILNSNEKVKALEVVSSIYQKINRLRKQDGIDELPAVEIKSEEINLNYSIKSISGKVSAKKFLKEYKSSLSNNNVENLIDHIFSLRPKINNNETEKKSQCEEASALGGKTNSLDSLFEQVALKINNK